MTLAGSRINDKDSGSVLPDAGVTVVEICWVVIAAAVAVYVLHAVHWWPFT